LALSVGVNSNPPFQLWPIRLPARILGFHPGEVGAAPTWATKNILDIKNKITLFTQVRLYLWVYEEHRWINIQEHKTA